MLVIKHLLRFVYIYIMALISFIKPCQLTGDFVVVAVDFIVSHPGLIELGSSTNLNEWA